MKDSIHVSINHYCSLECSKFIDCWAGLNNLGKTQILVSVYCLSCNCELSNQDSVYCGHLKQVLSIKIWVTHFRIRLWRSKVQVLNIRSLHWERTFCCLQRNLISKQLQPLWRANCDHSQWNFDSHLQTKSCKSRVYKKKLKELVTRCNNN